MKKCLIAIFSSLLLVCNISAKPVEYGFISVKSLNDCLSKINELNTDLQLGAAVYSLPMLISQSLSEGYCVPALDKPIAVCLIADEELDVENVFEAVCIPTASSMEAIVNEKKLTSVDVEKNLYEAEGVVVIFKGGYAIFAENQSICEFAAGCFTKAFKTSFPKSLVTANINLMVEDKLSLEKDFSFVEEAPKAVKQALTRFFNFCIEVAASQESVEIGLDYEKGVGFVLESKSYFDKTSEMYKKNKSVDTEIKRKDLLMINPSAIVSSKIAFNETEKYVCEKFIEACSLSRDEFNEIYSFIVDEMGEECAEMFPELKEDGMNDVCYNSLKKLGKAFSDSIKYSNGSEAEVLFDKKYCPIMVGKSLYAPGFDYVTLEKETYQGMMSLYKFILEKADYNPTKPFISLVGPTALNVNTKEIAKTLEIPDSINLNEVDDNVFASTTFDIYIPDSYTIQTVFDGATVYEFIAPGDVKSSELKAIINSKEENAFVKAAIADMPENKVFDFGLISVGNLYNAIHDFITPYLSEEVLQALKEMEINKREKPDAIMCLRGITLDGATYERVVVGSDTIISLAPIFLFGVEASMQYDEPEYIDCECIEEECGDAVEPTEEEIIEYIPDEE